jgi:hypothetical protein
LSCSRSRSERGKPTCAFTIGYRTSVEKWRRNSSLPKPLALAIPPAKDSGLLGVSTQEMRDDIPLTLAGPSYVLTAKSRSRAPTSYQNRTAEHPTKSNTRTQPTTRYHRFQDSPVKSLFGLKSCKRSFGALVTYRVVLRSGKSSSIFCNSRYRSQDMSSVGCTYIIWALTSSIESPDCRAYLIMPSSHSRLVFL